MSLIRRISFAIALFLLSAFAGTAFASGYFSGPAFLAPQFFMGAAGRSYVHPTFTSGVGGSLTSCNGGASLCWTGTVPTSTAGHGLLVFGCSRNFSTPPNFINDSASNSYSSITSFGNYCTAWYDCNASSVTTITVGEPTAAVNTSDVSITSFELVGFASSGCLDVSNFTNTGSSMAPSFGPTSALAGPGEIVFAFLFSHDSSTMTPVLAGYATPINNTIGNMSNSAQTETQSGTSAVTYAPTSLASGIATGGIVVMK